jgi:uncharacterized protein (UPF0248 family)
MLTEKEMLNKIQWDKNFNPIDCEIGYLHNNNLIYIEFEDMLMEQNNNFNFTIFPKGKETQIPFHRIKEIKYENKIIWNRNY